MRAQSDDDVDMRPTISQDRDDGVHQVADGRAPGRVRNDQQNAFAATDQSGQPLRDGCADCLSNHVSSPGSRIVRRLSSRSICAKAFCHCASGKRAVTRHAVSTFPVPRYSMALSQFLRRELNEK